MNAVTKIKGGEGGLLAALAVALPELEGAKKNAANPHLKSKYADLGSVLDAIRPIANHGIWFLQETHESERGITIETHYIGFGEKISAGKLFVPANKQDAQGYGSALTYARRYSLQTAFGLSAEDDDGHAAVRGQSKESAVSPAAAPLSDDEWARIVTLCKATTTQGDEVKAHVGADNLKLVTPKQYAAAVEYLENKLAKMAKAETNAKAKEDA